MATYINFWSLLGVLVEFKDTVYSVIEDETVFEVTLVKQGDPGQSITVSILPNETVGTARCK